MVGSKMNIHLSIKKLEEYNQKHGHLIENGEMGVEEAVKTLIEENTGSTKHPLYETRERRRVGEPKRVVCDKFNKFTVVWNEKNGFESGEYRIDFQGFYKEMNSNILKKYSSTAFFEIN